MSTASGPIDTPLKYLFYNTMTGQFIEQLPLRGVNFSGGPVNQSGSFQGNLDIQDPNIGQKTDWIRATAPTFATLIVDYDGDIVWGGPVTGRKETFDSSGFKLEIDAVEGCSWWNQVVQATDYSSPPYSGITGTSGQMPLWNAGNVSSSVPGYGSQPYIWDPMCIAAQILYDACAVPYQNIYGGMNLSFNGFSGSCVGGVSGVQAALADYLASGSQTPVLNYISINFPYTSLQTINALLSQLQSLGVDVGFDTEMQYAYGGNGKTYAPLEATFALSYPTEGTPLNVGAPLVFTLGNALAWNFPEDGTSQATTVYETGGNQDIVVVQNVFPLTGGPDTPYGDMGYPNTARVMNIANMNSPDPTALLQQMGVSDLNLYSWPPTQPGAQFPLFDPICGLGTFKLGSQGLITIPANDQDGKPFDPRFPGGDISSAAILNNTNVLLWGSLWRAVSWTANVSDQGVSTFDVQFDTPPITSRTTPTLSQGV
jgi:hypothetical protein